MYFGIQIISQFFRLYKGYSFYFLKTPFYVHCCYHAYFVLWSIFWSFYWTHLRDRANVKFCMIQHGRGQTTNTPPQVVRRMMCHYIKNFVHAIHAVRGLCSIQRVQMHPKTHVKQLSYSIFHHIYTHMAIQIMHAYAAHKRVSPHLVCSNFSTTYMATQKTTYHYCIWFTFAVKYPRVQM